MRFPRRVLPQGFHNPTILLTSLFATIGGALADLAGLPLGWLLGSLLVSAAAALTGWRPLGHPVQLWPGLRAWFIPVIGVAIGASFTPQILQQASAWWPSLLALCVFIPLVHALCFWLTMRDGRVDRVTAFFGTVPGGLIESVELGAERGADIAMLTMLQFLRLILVIVCVPLAFTLLTGHAVGSASGAVMGGAEAHEWGQLLILAAAGVAGVLVGAKLHFPAAIMTGPILASGLLHLLGLVEGAPPAWLIAVTQIVVGTSLGVRFAGLQRHHMLAALKLSVVNTGLALLLALVMAAALTTVQQQSAQAVFLAFAPGGIAEMSLIALSLDIGVVFVTAHHVLRIVLSIAFARALSGRVLDGTRPKSGQG
ncbi:AbrB family transcriptional regulator [Paracoccus tegillarcae]|uniref:Aminopeptidase n=1 Tax=Paracoccus tegillarcae TaxID=1529068 RepID=A0A2K9EKG9_9RHOB|nr:AbrB family transcriptional regulator [Paracoccus tegillarcae]AUH34909.1 aminopeptidase [Paracoccus tegillarcae]